MWTVCRKCKTKRAKQTLSFHLSGLVHAAREKFKNAASLLRFDLRSTLILHETRAFRERPSKPEEIENAKGLVLVRSESMLKTDLFGNDDVATIVWFPCLSFKRKCKMSEGCGVFKFLRYLVDGKYLMRFQSGTALSNFSGEVTTWQVFVYQNSWRSVS